MIDIYDKIKNKIKNHFFYIWNKVSFQDSYEPEPLNGRPLAVMLVAQCHQQCLGLSEPEPEPASDTADATVPFTYRIFSHHDSAELLTVH